MLRTVNIVEYSLFRIAAYEMPLHNVHSRLLDEVNSWS